ncbi:hypothetical protein I7I50_03434 [Histoplasma capsulatum G186AR]|uniref:Uncharacterized protein n=1 Tax=Ajellomyces capsulatus TaxID=5037 RepID=A0A8H7YNZ4_AJECA|nr:hypothetical protein I7I52_04341 [Histoplasma capsulatum]QSS74581.1 hypothetical protein I7I50_03434 [Histoplasma capsulatum G186AR]
MARGVKWGKMYRKFRKTFLSSSHGRLLNMTSWVTQAYGSWKIQKSSPNQMTEHTRVYRQGVNLRNILQSQKYKVNLQLPLNLTVSRNLIVMVKIKLKETRVMNS